MHTARIIGWIGLGAAMCGLLLAGPAAAGPPADAPEGGEINPFTQGETGLTKPPPCGPKTARLMGQVTSGAKPLEGASIHLRARGVPLRRAAVAGSVAGGAYYLCFDTRGPHTLTVLAPGHRAFSRRVVIQGSESKRVDVALERAAPGAPDACEQLGGAWLCSSQICPPDALRSHDARTHWAGCEPCNMPGDGVTIKGRRPCPCFCTFSPRMKKILGKPPESDQR